MQGYQGRQLLVLGRPLQIEVIDQYAAASARSCMEVKSRKSEVVVQLLMEKRSQGIRFGHVTSWS